MTEAQWLACTNPIPMIEYLRRSKRHGTSERKLRLFSCACCRRIWDFLHDRRSQGAVEMAERHAEGLAGDQELLAANGLAQAAEREAEEQWGGPTVQAGAARAAEKASRLQVPRARRARTGREIATHVALYTSNDAHWTELWAMRGAVTETSLTERMRQVEARQSGLLRDMVGNPFRPISPGPWLTPTVFLVAQAAYESRTLPSGLLDHANLAILADALQDAGCQENAVLSHCRLPGEHVRGCWVLDLILEKP
jgi:hypothetical protein